ncbi:right-handed parallel beta-helix repeat-containing protein [Marinilongibacter aquaticus]|uniref:right-handed parallel beta-helix repeat-containing protein n=1 Tax=Marinilongibacter aquaticus TaxID=2975157 RepID=UPI0021BD85FB|nr:right-handed parallel beta-helix repeat-containing protein [Marinilongibacter aquaticus]UBM58853.1 right-handed parallel beta-helix repeat-containing protein [Marinilongibacter aquaticus]
MTLNSCKDDNSDECKVVCGTGEILSADCNCVAVVTDPCDDVTCPDGFVCADGNCVEVATEPTEVSKAGLLTADETWTADKMYILQSKVVVSEGVTLTIEPGTIIKGAKGQGSLATALIVARGGKIMAEGTAEKPIVFTALSDNIEIGQTFGSNLDETVNSEWGGVIILGKAPISPSAGTEAQIEGIPADDTFGAYGGSDAADNSGVFKFVSIRHGGALIGDGNEINGLTLGGVGSGTTIENVEIVGNLDDGIEFFGGAVNVKNALVWGQGDDGYDIDQSFSGTIENSIYIAGADSDHAMEIDGPEGPENTGGLFTIKNCSFKGLNGEFADWRDKAQGTVMDCYFFNFDEAADIELDADATVEANYVAGKIVITGNEFNLAAAVTDFASIFKDTFAGGDDAAFKADMVANNASVTEKSAGKGADASVFGWTFASSKGAIDGF